MLEQHLVCIQRSGTRRGSQKDMQMAFEIRFG